MKTLSIVTIVAVIGLTAVPAFALDTERDTDYGRSEHLDAVCVTAASPPPVSRNGRVDPRLGTGRHQHGVFRPRHAGTGNTGAQVIPARQAA